MELLCLEFMNSEFREFRGRWVRDDLRQPEWLAYFLEKWHLEVEQPVADSFVEELVELRALLIRVVGRLNLPEGVDAQDLELLNACLAKTIFHYQIAQFDQKLRLVNVPIQQNWDWVQNEIIADFLTLLTSYEPQRLKMCENPKCRWVFYDETKSRTRRYCSIDKCANLMKIRRYRDKQRAKK